MSMFSLSEDQKLLRAFQERFRFIHDDEPVLADFPAVIDVSVSMSIFSSLFLSLSLLQFLICFYYSSFITVINIIVCISSSNVLLLNYLLLSSPLISSHLLTSPLI